MASRKNWRWNYNTGGGQLMDWIGHHCDIAHWASSIIQFKAEEGVVRAGWHYIFYQLEISIRGIHE